MLTQTRLKEKMEYYPETGVFIWLRDHRMIGKEAGCLKKYHMIVLDGVCYPRSKLAWLYMTGVFPTEIVDHKNTISGDDRWENLRLATVLQNMANKGAWGSLPKGVSRSGLRYKVQIKINGEAIYLGQYKTPEEAGEVYRLKAVELYGEFAYGQ